MGPEVVINPIRVPGTPLAEEGNPWVDRGRGLVVPLCPLAALAQSDEEPPTPLITPGGMTIRAPGPMAQTPGEVPTRGPMMDIGSWKTVGPGTNTSISHTSRKFKNRVLI